MYCPSCGTQNADDSKFCQNCGKALTGDVETPQVTPTPMTSSQPQTVTREVRTSGLAVASLILGIIGLLINLLGVLAIIFGAISLGQINREPELGGKGMAIAGLVLGIISVAIWILVIIFASSIFWLAF
jgi:hypothetical protein